MDNNHARRPIRNCWQWTSTVAVVISTFPGNILYAKAAEEAGKTKAPESSSFEVPLCGSVFQVPLSPNHPVSLYRKSISNLVLSKLRSADKKFPPQTAAQIYIKSDGKIESCAVVQGGANFSRSPEAEALITNLRFPPPPEGKSVYVTVDLDQFDYWIVDAAAKAGPGGCAVLGSSVPILLTPTTDWKISQLIHKAIVDEGLYVPFGATVTIEVGKGGFIVSCRVTENRVNQRRKDAELAIMKLKLPLEPDERTTTYSRHLKIAPMLQPLNRYYIDAD